MSITSMPSQEQLKSDAPEAAVAAGQASPVGKGVAVPDAAADGANGEPGPSPVSTAEVAAAAVEAVHAQAAARASAPRSDDFEEDEFGWAIGSELEFLEEGEPVDDWDGPVGDGLDEEEGYGGVVVSRDPSLDKALIDAAADDEPEQG